MKASLAGRTSNGPMRMPGWRLMIATASALSFASRTRMPPSISLVSANGPSVRVALPPVQRTVVAAAESWRA
jgi:hypothetical protein